MRTPQDLMAAIEQKLPLSEPLKAAFQAVNRAAFVPTYYQQVGGTWLLQKTGDGAYEDRPLITQLREQRPSSSSSMPSVMAVMLEGLDLQPGMRVLEIGTGTGYNAALLAHLIGPSGHLTTIDIDAELVAQAQKQLTHEIGQITAVVGDGCQGYPIDAPYERLLLTAGFRQIKDAWCEQLQCHGVLVGNLLGNLSSVLIKLEKEGPDTMRGEILPHGAFFMELRGKEDQVAITLPDWEAYKMLPLQEIQANPYLQEALKEQAFLFFLQGHYPELQFHVRAHGTPEQYQTYKVFLEPTTHASATLRNDGVVEARGHVWQRIEQHYQRYQEREAPKLKDYRLRFQQGKLVVYAGSLSWDV